ncbi:MAG: DUF559 domain-containing protein [Acidimicrobiales bacterium]
MAHRPDHTVAHLAARQDGVFSRRQATEAGFSRSTILRRLRERAWISVDQRVLTLGDWPSTYRQLLWTGVLAIPGSAVSRRSAGGLHSMPGLHTKIPTLTVAKGQRHQGLPGVRIHETRRLHAVDKTQCDGLSVTTPARTLIDVAAELSYARLGHVIDQSVQAGIVSREELLAAFLSITRRGRKGCRKLRRYLENRMDAPVQSVSELEYRFDQIIRGSGLPLPVEQFRPPWFDGIRGAVDRCWPQHQLIVELDGRSFHSTMQAMADDRRRDRVAQRHGYRVLRYTFAEVTHRAAEIIEDLETFLLPSPSGGTTRHM